MHYQYLIQPIFLLDNCPRSSINGLHNVYYENFDTISDQIAQDIDVGISKFIVFYIPQNKVDITNELHTIGALKQLSRIKEKFGNKIWLGFDICLCGHTKNGECFIGTNGSIDYEKTFHAFSIQASQAVDAGLDFIAPSACIKSSMKNIKQHVKSNIHIMGYSIKFQSNFYGGFRNIYSGFQHSVSINNSHGDVSNGDMINSKNKHHNHKIDPIYRHKHQIDYHSYDDAYQRFVDDKEYIDSIIIKPAYLDIIYRIAQHSKVPIIGYNISNECIAIHDLHAKNMLNRAMAFDEIWTGMLRAGASMIISYDARNAMQYHKEVQSINANHNNINHTNRII